MFKTKQISHKNSRRIGEILKQAREEKNISLEEVGEATKIQRGYLEDIENGEYQNLPPDVYTCGFIKQCASFLGLDAGKIILLYKRERCIQKNLEDKRAKFRMKTDSKKFDPKRSKRNSLIGSSPKRKLFIVTPKILTFLLGIFVLAGITFYLWHQINSFNSVPYLYISEPAEDQMVSRDRIYLKGQAEKDVELKINGETVYLDFLGNFEAEINLQEGLNVITIEAENHFGRKAEAVRRIIYDKNK